MKFQRILLSLDLSDRSNNAIDTCLQLIDNSRGTIVLAHVLELSRITPPTDLGTGGANLIDKWRSQHLEDVTEILDQVRKNHFQKIKTEIAIITPTGRSTAKALASCAEEESCDLIIMASRKNKKLKRLVAQTALQKVINLASCPVLAVPESVESRNNILQTLKTIEDSQPIVSNEKSGGFSFLL